MSLTSARRNNSSSSSRRCTITWGVGLHGERMNTTPAPLLPKITGELILQVFTHKSLRRSTGILHDECSDNERLAELGSKVLETVVTYNLFAQLTVTAREIQVRFPGSHFNTGIPLIHFLPTEPSR